MIYSEEPDLGTSHGFTNNIKAIVVILVLAGLMICGLLFALKASDPEPQKPITPYEKVINPKSMPDSFLYGKTN
jgi:hypothetical protein